MRCYQRCEINIQSTSEVEPASQLASQPRLGNGKGREKETWQVFFCSMFSDFWKIASR
jgi:hypothetical protein